MSKNPNVVKRTCTSCGKDKRYEEFYKSESMIHKHYNRINICKDCVDSLYKALIIKTNSERLAMYRLCRKLDYPFIHAVFDMGEKESNRRDVEIYRIYFQKLNSLGSSNGYRGDFDDSDDFEITLENSEDVESIKNNLLKDFTITPEMVIFWGTNLSAEDYMYLDSEYDDWISKYDIDSKSLELLVKNICFTNLSISKKRSAGESVDKDLETLRKLMGDSNLTPSKESALLDSSDQATFGNLIKKWENEKPIPEPDPEWKDVNNVAKWIRVWFTGHLSKMFGTSSGFEKEYDEEVAKYTVDLGDSDGS